MRVALSLHEKMDFLLTPELILSGNHKDFKKNQIVYKKGDSPKGIYYVLSGFLGLVNIAQNGGETLLRVYGKNELTGHRSFFSEEDYHATCLAISDAKLLYFPFENPNDCLTKNKALFFHLLKDIAKDLRIQEERLNDFSGKRASSRVIEGFLFLKLRYPGHVWTRKEIGEFCVTKMETVSRIFSKLEELGLIVKKGRDIEIPNQEALLKYSESLTID